MEEGATALDDTIGAYHASSRKGDYVDHQRGCAAHDKLIPFREKCFKDLRLARGM